MKLHNSLTKRKEEFKPIKDKVVTLYTCGPTVYDHAHIGNLRTYVFEDILRRTLKLAKYKVSHVMNLTDVDDKTIERSRREYPDLAPMEALGKLTAEYERIFFEDAAAIGIDFSETKTVRATEHIADMQEMIKRIDNKYAADDGIYFEINKYPDYGVFETIDQSHTHHRVQNDEYDKEHVADFALWKTEKTGEPSWDFELDDQDVSGRPGWHIECAAMSVKYLSQPFDIHTGGVDLKFPHHENEIAQAKAANGEDLAKTFLHAEHLLVNGKKMSKSLQNYHTLQDITDKGLEAMAFRLLMLQAHYRSQLNFTFESLAAAQKFLADLKAFADLRFQTSSATFDIDFDSVRDDVKNTLFDDLNTPQVLAYLSDLADRVVIIPESRLDAFGGFLKFIDDALGLKLAGSSDITDKQKRAIAERDEAKAANDYAKADQLRSDLQNEGIGLRDTEYGTVWYRTA